jgi:thioredoxin-related protein
MGSAQTNVNVPPYKRFPTVPPIQLLLGDSTTTYTKANIPAKKKVLIMLFSPECGHCQHTAEEIYQHREELKDVHIVMATIYPLYEMNDFMKKYKLSEMKNVVAGRDLKVTLPVFYAIRNFPYLAMYDKKGNLIMGFEGSMPIEKVIKIFKEGKPLL